MTNDQPVRVQHTKRCLACAALQSPKPDQLMVTTLAALAIGQLEMLQDILNALCPLHTREAEQKAIRYANAAGAAIDINAAPDPKNPPS